MQPFHFVIYAKPHGKDRPRFRQGHGVYTPKATTDLETEVRLACYEAMAKARKETLFQGPLSIDLTFFMPIPKSWSKRKKDDARFMRILPTTKPDWDNLGKLVCDALNRVLYVDDSQIVDARVRKLYADIPRIEVTVEALNPEDEA